MGIVKRLGILFGIATYLIFNTYYYANENLCNTVSKYILVTGHICQIGKGSENTADYIFMFILGNVWNTCMILLFLLLLSSSLYGLLRLIVWLFDLKPDKKKRPKTDKKKISKPTKTKKAFTFRRNK